MSLPAPDWMDLAKILIGAVIGWLGNWLNPAPGTQRAPRKGLK